MHPISVLELTKNEVDGGGLLTELSVDRVVTYMSFTPVKLLGFDIVTM